MRSILILVAFLIVNVASWLVLRRWKARHPVAVYGAYGLIVGLCAAYAPMAGGERGMPRVWHVVAVALSFAALQILLNRRSHRSGCFHPPSA